MTAGSEGNLWLLLLQAIATIQECGTWVDFFLLVFEEGL